MAMIGWVALVALLFGGGAWALRRGSRPLEGQAIIVMLAFFTLLAGVALHAKQEDLNAPRVNLNDLALNAVALATQADTPLQLAESLIAYRNRLPGHAFRSFSSVPELSRATACERCRLQELASTKDWDAVQRVMRTGILPPPPSPSHCEGKNKPCRDASDGMETLSPGQNHGLYPGLELRVRAAALLPNPPWSLSRSPRAALFAALGDAAVARRIAQYRTLENPSVTTLSEITALSTDRIALRSPPQARAQFIGVMLLLGALLLGGHLWLRRALPHADTLLWPLFGGMGMLGVTLLFAVSSPLTARGSVWPALGVVPEAVGQGFAVALGMMALPFSGLLLRFGESVGRRWLAGLLGAAILTPNVVASGGAVGKALVLLALIGLASWVWLQSAWGARTGSRLAERLRAWRRGDAAADGSPVDGASSAPVGSPAPAAAPSPATAASPALSSSAMSSVPARVALLVAVTAVLTVARVRGGHAGYAPLVEASKLLLILFTARICSDYELFLGAGWGDLPARPRWEFAGCWLAAMALAFFSNDLGLLLLLWIPFTLLLSLSIGRAWPAVMGMVLLLAGAALLTASGHTRFPERMAMWLDPWSAPSSQMAEAFQRMASVPSVIAGAGLGRGVGLTISTDTRDVVLPLYYEQLGWVGIVLTLGLLLLAIHRLLRVGLRARDPFAHWVTLGFGAIFATQTAYMVGAGFGAWPLTGMTLAPLASGKAAAFATLFMASLVVGVSGGPTAPSLVARRTRVRGVSAAFAMLALLLAVAAAKLVKVAVLDREQIALRPIAGQPNRRASVLLSALRTGPLLARSDALGYASGKIVPLAVSVRDAHDEERRRYSLGAAGLPVTGVMAEGRRAGGEDAWRGRLTGLDTLFSGAAPGLPVNAPPNQLALALWRRERHPLWPREVKVAPQAVQTTVVAPLQTAAYDALRSHLRNSVARSGGRPRKGAILMMDARTGDILAYAQYPAPNPETMTSGWEAWDRATHDTSGAFDSNGQLLDTLRHTDRAPGSTAKIITMMALSQAGMADRTFVCRPGVTVNGAVIRDHDNATHGRVNLRSILKVSCNRGAALATRAMGSDALLAQYRRLRFSLPHMDRPEAAFHRTFQQIAFGQAISASLWEMARATAAVARGGEAIEPHLLRTPPEFVETWRVCSPQTAARVAEGMRAVTEPGGTAWSVYRGRHDWPSKTGSAEVAGAKETDAWFVGYAPREKPAVVFVAWAEEDGTGGNLARALDLPSLVESALHSMGIVETPRVTIRRNRAPRNVEPDDRGPLSGLLERAKPLLDRPELQKPRRFLESLDRQAGKAQRSVEEFQRRVDRLRDGNPTPPAEAPVAPSPAPPGASPQTAPDPELPPQTPT